jgi:hypothetical protein
MPFFRSVCFAVAADRWFSGAVMTNVYQVLKLNWSRVAFSI